MRTRQEILNEVLTSTKGLNGVSVKIEAQNSAKITAILEVLLDIRELLTKEPITFEGRPLLPFCCCVKTHSQD